MIRVSAIALSLGLIALPAAADATGGGYARLFGTWGTTEQCARAPIKPGGTVLSAPVEIAEEWLRHGGIWCKLTWFPLQPRDDGLFTGALAQCGEDSVVSYSLRMNLNGDALTLRWDLLNTSGLLKRCPAR